jgi:type I restriction enzyme M protein
LKIAGIPLVVIDAKAPGEDIYSWEKQCSSYCLELNKSYEYNPVQLYCISNGLKTAVYKWDSAKALTECNFSDFVPNNSNYESLQQILGKQAVIEREDQLKEQINNQPFEYESIDLPALTTLFQKLHTLIWKAEQKSPSAAFTELMKIVFVKIRKDKEIHIKYGDNPKPKYSDVVFSQYWIQSETETKDPINDLLFRKLVSDLEGQIERGEKKRIFEPTERINLNPDTMNKVVKELEHIDFYAMEDDIHGRLFESFLDATIRGKDIGQFFTPRDIVNLMVRLADLRVSKSSNDCVLDACCGSGGFLIASMNEMLKKADNIVGISNTEKTKIEKRIKENSIYGVDAGSDPAMYRIARMNMYLHGDGGSKIYHADSLNKKFGLVGSPSIEETLQLEELQNLVANGKHFDVILSNPPFSVSYNRKDPAQSKILDTYTLGTDETGKRRSSLLSSVMFLERYADLVTDNGKILAIIDESILSGESYKSVRNYLRDKFVIIGIISLPGDAFKRASARVKTSILILRKKGVGEVQPELFMTASSYLGLEAQNAKRIGIPISSLQTLKSREFERITNEYTNFCNGVSGPYVVPANRIKDRLDVKYCSGQQGRKAQLWRDSGYEVTTLKDVLTQASNRKVSVNDGEEYQLLRVSYSGEISYGEMLDSESSYSTLLQVKTWDILISNMGVGRGATGIVPPYYDGKYVSNEYTILRANSKEETLFYATLLRTDEILADILSYTTGMNRGRVKWDTLQKIIVPNCDSSDEDLIQSVKAMEALWKQVEMSQNVREKQNAKISNQFHVCDPDARERWLSYKPPE